METQGVQGVQGVQGTQVPQGSIGMFGIQRNTSVNYLEMQIPTGHIVARWKGTRKSNYYGLHHSNWYAFIPQLKQYRIIFKSQIL